MTTSISNMTQVWMDANTHNGIAMSVSSLGYGPNAASKLIQLSLNGVQKFGVSANGIIYTTTFSVSTLPSASSVGAGARAFVTDASNSDIANNYSAVVSGGGGSFVPVYSDGSNWRIG
jgi:hypothetical protein